MRIPAAPKEPSQTDERAGFYRNVIRECAVTRPQRRELWRKLKQIYLAGEDGGDALYNRIYEWVDNSSSYIYQPDSVRFDVTLPSRYGDEWEPEKDGARADLHQWWRLSGADLVMDTAMEWAHIWTAILKVYINDNEPVVDLVPDPSDVGVYREDIPYWKRQEAIVHWYRLDLAAFERIVQAPIFSPQDREGLLASATGSAERSVGGGATILPPTQSRIILASASPTMTGAAQGVPVVPWTEPRSDARVVEMAELWIQDDALRDWRKVVMLVSGEQILWETESPQKGIDPFYQVCLNPLPNNIWGFPPIARLLLLQAWREKRMAEVDALQIKQLRPPIAVLGVSGITEEKAEVLRSADGILVTTMPGGSITPLPPQMPPDAFAVLDGIDKMFDRMGGMPTGSGAEDTPGARSGDQVMARASLGSPRTRKRAMRAEATVSDVATAALRLRARLNPKELRKPGGGAKDVFLLEDLARDMTAMVDAHSTSPMYAQLTEQNAYALHQRGVIDDETLVGLLNMPMAAKLAAAARRQQKAKAERAQQVLELKKEEAAAKVMKAQK